MNSVFSARLAARRDEMMQLYGELYHHDENAFNYFCSMLERCFEERKASLRTLDEQRLAEPDWFRSNKLMGMMLYVNAFAGDLRGVREKLPYLEECGINYLHLMPLLVDKELKLGGDVKELERLNTQDCIGCGSCSYVCPCNIPLVERMVQARKRVQSEKAQEDDR